MTVIHMAARRPLTLADLKPDEYAKVCTSVHESGHALAGVLLGGELFSAAVYRSCVTGLDGVTKFRELAIGRDPAVAYSGPYAEARFCAGGRRHPGRREIDRVLAGRGCRDYRAITAAGATTADVSAEAADLIGRCWGPIITVAQQLYRDGEVTHRDVCAALSIPETDNGHHLALIRSGSAPGSFTVTQGVTA